MRISWLSPTQLQAARRQFVKCLTSGVDGSPDWETCFAPDFVVPSVPAEIDGAHWPLIAEHIARAERITAVLQTEGLAAARERFAHSGVAIEAATLAAAARFADELVLADVVRALRCPIDPYVFYANLLELLVALQPLQAGAAPGDSLLEYETFVANYQNCLQTFDFGGERIAVAFDGLADLYVSRGVYDRAEAIFLRRHDEESGDVSVALSASRAYLAAGLFSAAVAWLERGSARARHLGRHDMASKLDAKRDVIDRRLS
ncbi:MAG: hypothetical protein KBG15_01540 [Kofleriaceae bacterium]|nr:hypothetical protein [Kofleriaceae bacterium]